MSQRLKTAILELNTLAQIAGKNDKIEFMKNIADDTKYLLLVLNSNEYVFGLKKPFVLSTCTPNSVKTMDELKRLIEELASNNINDDFRATTVEFLKQCPPIVQSTLNKLLTKTLKLGVTANSINKAIPNLIPEFKVALADTDDKPLVGNKIVEVKYDGVRCIAKVYLTFSQPYVNLYTRQGKKLHFPKIEQSVLQFCKNATGNTTNYMLDGELDVMTESRLGISGICNSNIKTGYVDGADLTLQYTAFDIMELEDFENRACKTKQRARTEMLEAFMLHQKEKPVQLALAKSVVLDNEADITALTNHYIAKGLEGTIVKDPEALYPFKRSKCWLKYKAVNSCTLVCVATTEGTNKRQGKIGALCCESADGLVKVDVGSGLTDALVDTYTEKSPIGLFIEVEYNVMLHKVTDNTYSLFLPRYKEVRIDKEVADTAEKMIKDHIGKIEETTK